jgi:hypothetical protein
MQQHLHLAVSQYDKTHLPTPKTAATKGLEVRQQPKNCLHTPTHPRKNNGADTGDHEAMEPKKITDFIALVKNLYPQFIVSFTAHSYLKTHFSNCSKQHLDLFLNLVQSFTLLHHTNRRTTVENVLAAFETDYIEAFKLWQHCQPKQPKIFYMPTVQRVLQFLQYRYEGNVFTAQKIALQLNYNTDYINTILQQLLQQQKIEFAPNSDNKYQRLFKLKK